MPPWGCQGKEAKMTTALLLVISTPGAVAASPRPILARSVPSFCPGLSCAWGTGRGLLLASPLCQQQQAPGGSPQDEPDLILPTTALLLKVRGYNFITVLVFTFLIWTRSWGRRVFRYLAGRISKPDTGFPVPPTAVYLWKPGAWAYLSPTEGDYGENITQLKMHDKQEQC